MANSGSWLQYSREGIINTWQAGMASDSSYVVRASNSTNVVTVNQNGNTTISGNLDVGVSASSSKIDVHCNQQGQTGYTELHCQSPWVFKLELISTHSTPRSLISPRFNVFWI